MIMRVFYIIFCMLTFLLQGCAVGHTTPVAETFHCYGRDYYKHTAFFVDTIRIENPVVLRSRNLQYYADYYFVLPFEEAKNLKHDCTDIDILYNPNAAFLDLDGEYGLFYSIDKLYYYTKWFDITGNDSDRDYEVDYEHPGLPDLKYFAYLKRDIPPVSFCLFLVRGDTYNCAIGICIDCDPHKPIMFKNPCAYYRYCTPIWR